MKPTNEKRLSCVRTVVDVEEGSVVTPVSPPATEQDRAEFQRLLNGLSTGGKDGTVSKIEMSGEVSTQEPSNAPGKAGVISDSDSVKPSQKTKKKRGGKKSNKSSPTDSPKRTTGEGNEQPEDNVLASKKDQQLTAQKNESQAPNSLSGTSLPMPKEPSDHVRSSKSSKVFQNVKVARQVMQNTQGIERLELDENKRNPTKPGEFMKKSLKDSKDLNEANCVLQDRSLVKLEHCTSHSSKGDPEVVDSVFKRQPLLLLRAAVNLIRPEKKIQSLKDLNFFYCSVCDREFPDLDKHVEKSRDHLSRWKCKMRQQTVAMLPDLSSKHISLLDNLVATTVKKCEISEEQYLKAQTLWTDLDALARKSFKGCSVRWFGSHANRIAMCDSVMLNMDFLVQSKEDAATTFLKFISAVEENFKTVDRVVATNFAHAHIHHNEFVVQLSLNNNGAFNLSKLIQEYINIDKRVQPLCQFFRYWGKICRVDQGENGSWQGHAFPIMVIHFLQQKLVLPVLHDMVENPDKNPEIYLDPRNLPGQWSCQNGDSVGLLLFQMFSYYAVEHDVGKHVVCITQKKPYLRSATKWNAKRIAVMDPFLQKHNISRYISASMYDYIHYCLVSTACALGIPRTNLGPLFGYIARRPNPSFFEQTPDVLKEYLDVTETIFELVLRVDSSYNMPDLRRNNEEQAPKLAASLRNSAVYRELMKPLRVVPRVTDKCQVHPPPENAYAFWWVTPYQAAKLTSQVNQDLLQVTLTKYMCTDNEVPPVICTSCHKSGHLRTDCPDEIIPKMNAVLPPSKDLNAILDKLCLSIFETQCSEESGVRDRFEICQDIHGFLRHFWRPDIELHLFGSSLNGFGGRSSDIDICLTFRSNADGEGLNFPAIVEEIQMSLRGHKNIHQPQAITTAKVPIVKFLYGRNNIQVDISLYNRLGMMNTQLLRTYSVIDQRVRPLVYMMKSLAKATGIGDASRGSLSSCAYSLMSLFFLQQVEPPVIPVLQELYDPSVKRNEEIMDGANVYFFQNLEKLSEVWPHGGANKSTLGELWLQLLEFYASDIFHNSQQVVCIRKKAPLFKFDKLWTSTNICIEDPFDLNHNLGSGLSKRMNIFIVRTFQKACKHFSSLPNVLLTRPMALEDYYFNEDSLSVGKPPSDRGCHYCRSIGHVQNDCPSRRLMMQQRQAAVRLRGRQNRGNIVRQAPHDFERSNRGGRREYVQDPRSHDPGRISNMPMPMRAPLPVQSGAPGVYAVRSQQTPQQLIHQN